MKKKLEKNGFIKGYSIYINVFKLDIYLFIFFIQNKNLEQRKKLFTYLQNHPKVTLLQDYIEDPFIEFDIFVKNPYETRKSMQKFLLRVLKKESKTVIFVTHDIEEAILLADRVIIVSNTPMTIIKEYNIIKKDSKEVFNLKEKIISDLRTVC